MKIVFKNHAQKTSQIMRKNLENSATLATYFVCGVQEWNWIENWSLGQKSNFSFYVEYKLRGKIKLDKKNESLFLSSWSSNTMFLQAAGYLWLPLIFQNAYQFFHLRGRGYTLCGETSIRRSEIYSMWEKQNHKKSKCRKGEHPDRILILREQDERSVHFLQGPDNGAAETVPKTKAKQLKIHDETVKLTPTKMLIHRNHYYF